MLYINFFKNYKTEQNVKDKDYIEKIKSIKVDIPISKELIIIALVTTSLSMFTIFSGFFIFNKYEKTSKIKLDKVTQEQTDLRNYYNRVLEMKKKYDNDKKDNENIYNIVNKAVKWSNITKEIADILPYDISLTKIESISYETFLEEMEKEEQNKENKDILTEEELNEKNKQNNQQNQQQNNQNQQQNNQQNNKQNNKDEKDILITNNNIILIEGKALTMVNLSVFLSKLDNSDLFIKTEYKSGMQDENGNIQFKIYAFLKPIE